MTRLLACSLAAGLVAPFVAIAASQDFSLTNRTGYQIDMVYVTEAGSRDWGNDVLGRDALKPGEQADIGFDRATRVCRWDLRVRYHDATEAVWNGLDLCALKSVALFLDPVTHVTIARGQ